MSNSIFDESNEEYLRKLIETDEKLVSEAKTAVEKIIAPSTDIREVPGNKSVSPSLLPSKGIFYPADLVITISPLKVKHIRHFSTIDENDEIDINYKLNFIVNASIGVQTNQAGFTAASLLEIDRLYLLFLVRNITFTEFQSVIRLQSTCNHCETSELVDVKAERLGALTEGALDDYLSLYSQETRSIEIQLHQETIQLYFPSMQNLSLARKQIIEQNTQPEQQDKYMLCFLVSPDKKLTSADFDAFDKEIEDWTPDKYSIVRSFVDTINSSYSIDVYYKCSTCSAGVATPLRFHRGIKELFIPEFSNRS